MAFDTEKKWDGEMGFHFSSNINTIYIYIFHSQAYMFKSVVKLELFSNLQHFKK